MLTAKCEYRGTFQGSWKTSQKVCFNYIFVAVKVAASMGEICGKILPAFRTKFEGNWQRFSTRGTKHSIEGRRSSCVTVSFFSAKTWGPGANVLWRFRNVLRDFEMCCEDFEMCCEDFRICSEFKMCFEELGMCCALFEMRNVLWNNA